MAPPMIQPVGTGPQNLLSSDSPRLSPIMNQCPAGILIGVGKLHSGTATHCLMYGSCSRTPLRVTCPSRIEITSPGPPTMRLMKFTLDCTGSGSAQAAPNGCSSLCGTGPQISEVACLGGWNTTISPT